MPPHLTSAQLRAARALLNWSQSDLAKAASISEPTIHRIENNATQPGEKTCEKLQRAIEFAGVEFTENQGVRFKTNDVSVYEGIDGFRIFHDTVYEHLRQNGGDACVYGSSSSTFEKHRTNAHEHRARMTSLVQQRKDVSFRVIACEGDMTMPNKYATYRWQPKEFFPTTAFYAFGDYLGLISFSNDNPPYIVLIKSKIIAESYRQSFNLAWKNAKIPPKQSTSFET